MSAKSKTLKTSKPVADPKIPGKITATSQTSRFHVDTLTTLSKEIDLKQVNLMIGNRDILTDAHLRLKSDAIYGLVGRNGQGKSTLLKAMVEKLIPGLPENLRILLVGQVEDTAQSEQLGMIKKEVNPSVVQHVVQSDTRRETLLWEQKTLSEAVDSGSTMKTAVALAKVLHARELKSLELAQKIASKRSGARGSEARKELLAAEARVVESQARLIESEQAPNPADDSKTMEQINGILDEVQGSLDAINSDATEAQARSILLGLGFAAEQLDAKYESLSGGWRSRCTLASALLQKPDILILDEPTNYLDIPSVIWLQQYLEELEDTTIVIVAHDRDFLDSVTQETIILHKRSLRYYEGSISSYERAVARKRKSDIRTRDALDKKRAAVEKTISEGAKAAKKSGDDNKARMVKSRQKKLDERWGLERNDKGHRFKLNRDFGGYHLTSRSEIIIEDLDPPVNLPFPDPEPMRFPGSLCSATDISFRYTTKTGYILEEVTITVQPGDRVGLVGKNGEGKSTLVKLLIGNLKPTKGKVERHPRLRMGYYSQHSVEELSNPNVSSRVGLEYFTTRLKELHNIDLDEGTARQFLGAFGLHGTTAVSPIATLSGGQKVRLALALIVYPAPDLLVLDEVSTHLDMDTTAGLIRALRKFEGAILLVSHDRHLVRCVIEGGPLIPASELADDDEDPEEEDDEDEENAKVGKVYRVGPKGRVKHLPGGVNDYIAIVERRLAKAKG